MDILEKLTILADSAKYDASCSSSGSRRTNTKEGIGNGDVSGICHSWGADGRCISLLKILMSNACIYDCKYCLNRKSNYIEGLFLSSAVIKNPDFTMERLYETVLILRKEYKFNRLYSCENYSTVQVKNLLIN